MMDLAAVSPLTLGKQCDASDPAASVWVSANAGSGKTHVLAQRVVRLLLKGTPPAKILCLTFTKAAAANMSIRVSNTLAQWTRLDDSALRDAIVGVGASKPGAADLREARKLFARTVETPGGLKIQTIHAFCERLLHLFPFEANAPSRFEVADEERQADLLSRARRDVLARAAQSDGALAAIVARVAENCSGAGFDGVLREALALRALLRDAWPGDHETVLRKALDIARGRDCAAIERDMIEAGLTPSRWTDLAAFFEGGTKIDCEKASALRSAATLHAAGDVSGCIAAYREIFFTQKNEKRTKLVTAGLAKEKPDLAAALVAEQERLETLDAEMKSAAAFERSCALGRLVDSIHDRYQAMKSRAGVLDFDDLVGRALALLERSDASWVLYKLDAGVDHILIDEAQDTSAAQWRILERLMADFAVGESGARSPRTFFAVGDEKQSIFSFQGAAPHEFHERRQAFARKFAEGGERFLHIGLTHSFRSAGGVLAAVDCVFGDARHQGGLVASSDVWMPHEALKAKLPGLVEIWPVVGAAREPERKDWRLPLDRIEEGDPASVVAARVADKIAHLVDPASGECVHDGEGGAARPVQPGDILVLVRRRGPFFEAVIRALKRRGVAVAGADRLKLGDHIAVLDLVAAGRAALLPDDDLTLAAVLKSPLVGLDDDDLIALCPGRRGSLYAALQASRAPRHLEAAHVVARWRARATQKPFAFYASLLGQDRGRRAFESRLGREAADAVDEFLRLALDSEGDPAPSLAGFLAGFETVERSVKRDMESGGGLVRVMTVHAAKGLEAKIVFLPDTCGGVAAQHDPAVYALDEVHLGARPALWSPKKAEDCEKAASARAKARELAEDEYRRLLYVALTRAEERIYIAGFHGLREPPALCWSNMVKATLLQDPGLEMASAFWNPDESVARLVSPGRPGAARAPFAAVAAEPSMPDWLARRADVEAEPSAPLRPSSALAAADRRRDRLIGGSRVAARAGALTHVLLQHLPDQPAERRRAAGAAYLASRAPDLTQAERIALVEAALAVIEAQDLAPLFGPASKAEAGVAGAAALPGGRVIEIAGRIDRLAATQTELIVADFKTGAPPPRENLPQSYVAQMALYRAALQPLWPELRPRMLLIWTQGPRVDEIGEASLAAALAAIEAGAQASEGPSGFGPTSLAGMTPLLDAEGPPS